MKMIFASIQILLLLVITACLSAQTVNQPGLQVSPRLGYDIPFFNNNTPYIKYKGGLSAGLSIDYYWKKWGIGADADYISNKPKSTYPTANLINAASISLTSFSLSENPVTRFFYGIGPGYKYQSATGKLTFELNGRIGLTSIKEGRTELKETSTSGNELLNFHAGYNAKSILSAKAQIRGTYFFKPTIGISFGAYYLSHFNVPGLTDPALGFSAKYLQPVAAVTGTQQTGNAYTRTKPCNCDMSSAGIYAGLVIKLGKKKEKKRPEDCKPEYSLVVTAKDKYTGQILPGTEVKAVNNDGTVALSGITNSYGVVVFENLKPFEYSISGTLASSAMEGTKATYDEFMKKKVVQKTILYADRNFIIKGKIYECNSSKAISGVSVILENTEQAYKRITLSEADGSFMIQLPQAGTYSLYGKKDKYLSQLEEVTASNYSRDKNLFVQLEICAEQADCGKAIQLKNILFDLDKYAIKEAAKIELNRLVKFMKDNPSIKVELSSHTDCRASHDYNETLSQNRANASVDYIVSQGISPDRLIGKGYGETKLLNKCADGVNCTEAEHAINRRTEMKVICDK